MFSPLSFVALLASVYKNSSLYLPFDSKEISLRVSDDFSEALNSSDSANGLFTPGPINEAYCTSYTGSTKLFDIKSNCFQNFESCSDGFSLTFWMKSASLDKLTPNVTYSLMTIDVFYMSYKFDIKNVNKLTLIVVKRNTTSKCNYFTVVPANIWFHLGFVLNGNHINVYINGRYGTVLKKECHANEVYVRDQVATVGGIGHSLCIDDLSVWMTPLSSDKVYRIFSQGRNKFVDTTFNRFGRLFPMRCHSRQYSAVLYFIKWYLYP